MSEVVTNKAVRSAPSNIALIKYMGKVSSEHNLPTNSSLSYTLEAMRTFVEITELPDQLTDQLPDQWEPLPSTLERPVLPIQLTEKSRDKFLRHFQLLKKEFQVTKRFRIRSANNFASDCGLASSASSFAALTKAAVAAFKQYSSIEIPYERLMQLSRRGSGSSCRSLVGPWAIWDREGVRPVEFGINQLSHQVIVIESKAKEVSSSQAHERVLTSLNFKGRPERAQARMAELIFALKEVNWKKAFDISWSEFMDMHSLFETSVPAFGYMLPDSTKGLLLLRKFWNVNSDGPLVTMDAGANIHLLWRPDQTDLQSQFSEEFNREFPDKKIMSSVQGESVGDFDRDSNQESKA